MKKKILWGLSGFEMKTEILIALMGICFFVSGLAFGYVIFNQSNMETNFWKENMLSCAEQKSEIYKELLLCEKENCIVCIDYNNTGKITDKVCNYGRYDETAWSDGTISGIINECGQEEQVEEQPIDIYENCTDVPCECIEWKNISETIEVICATEVKCYFEKFTEEGYKEFYPEGYATLGNICLEYMKVVEEIRRLNVKDIFSYFDIETQKACFRFGGCWDWEYKHLGDEALDYSCSQNFMGQLIKWDYNNVWLESTEKIEKVCTKWIKVRTDE